MDVGAVSAVDRGASPPTDLVKTNFVKMPALTRISTLI
jgi:hypothetical protein